MSIGIWGPRDEDIEAVRAIHSTLNLSKMNIPIPHTKSKLHIITYSSPNPIETSPHPPRPIKALPPTPHTPLIPPHIIVVDEYLCWKSVDAGYQGLTNTVV